MNYLVTGAAGGFGGYALDVLKNLVSKENIYGLARNEDEIKILNDKGFHGRLGDYADIDSLNKAMEGIDRLLFISGAPGNRQEEHANVVQAAKNAGVTYIAYTSFPEADKATSELAADHIFTENVINEAGIAHTFLRNNWYLENELPLIGSSLNGGKFVYVAENGKTGWALKREYAEVAAKAVAGAISEEILELSGTPITYVQLAENLEEAVGKTVEVVSGDDKQFVNNLVETDTLPQPVAEMFLSFQHDIKNNQLNVTSTDFEKALGHPLMSRVDAIKELLS